MAQNGTAGLVVALLAIGSVGLLIATAAGASPSGGKAGTVERSGKMLAGNGQEFEWRVIHSGPGAEQPYTGQAKILGFGVWDASTVVAMAPTPAEAQGLVEDHLKALA